jgi:hypothetical protein
MTMIERCVACERSCRPQTREPANPEARRGRDVLK